MEFWQFLAGAGGHGWDSGRFWQEWEGRGDKGYMQVVAWGTQTSRDMHIDAVGI